SPERASAGESRSELSARRRSPAAHAGTDGERSKITIEPHRGETVYGARARARGRGGVGGCGVEGRWHADKRAEGGTRVRPAREANAAIEPDVSRRRAGTRASPSRRRGAKR